MKLNNRTAGILSLVLILIVTSGFISFKPFLRSDNQTNSLILNAFKNRSGSGDLPDWGTMDPQKDGYEGTSTNIFYEYLRSLANPPERKEVIVAVIDSGFDIEHPDLKNNIWTNEIEMNGTEGVDDDNNGYVDDFHGWNFLGNANYISLEVAREYKKLKKANTPKTDPYFIRVEDEYYSKKDETIATKDGIDQTLADVIESEAVLKQKNITTDPRKLQEISMSLPEGKLSDAASIILGVYLLFGADKDDLIQLKRDYDIKVKCLFDTTDTYTLVGDDPDNLSETNYGNNDVTEKNEEHGTHVSGIIASVKTGQAPFARLMLLRGVPNEGDERDKDIANAIRYAADNGANIINMSAGKYFSPDADYVVDAIKYAAEKNVLIVLSAGNEGDNITDIVNYPRKYYLENGQKKYFDNMIVVGANSWMKKWSGKMDPENKNLRYDLAAPFSNYSNTVVDIFAPGVQINSTIPGGKYKMIDGTSMASPEVAGVAAVLKAYYPDLTAAQLKDIIISSARLYPDLMVRVKEGPKKLFSNMSRSGGVVDLMSAFKKAGEVSAIQN
ncbi:MAG TPA: S8 family serine peptidase [Ignavibacteria bacterium]|nr:S8 family serine peptidase [Ignavibacteria bacterium]